MSKAARVGGRPTLGGMILQHVIVFLICIVFPRARYLSRRQPVG